MFNNIYTTFLKCIPILLCVAAVFFAGYHYRGLADDEVKSREEAVLRAKADTLARQEADIAKQLQSRLDALQEAKDVVEKVTVKEVQKPIYINQCFEDTGVALINKIGQGK